MPTTLDLKGVKNILVNSCPCATGPEAIGATEREWNYILWLHWEWVREHGGCECR